MEKKNQYASVSDFTAASEKMNKQTNGKGRCKDKKRGKKNGRVKSEKYLKNERKERK